MERIVVYTANIGSYDNLRDPLYKDPKVRYILFTNNPKTTSSIWEVHCVNNIDLGISNPQRIARYIKTHPEEFLPIHDINIWIDSKYEIRVKDFKTFVKANLQNDIACYKHSTGEGRICLYDEAVICIDNKLDDINIIQKQISRYREKGFPSKLGLFDTAIMIRKNNDNVRKFNLVWWNEIRFGSKRDQLSQMFVSWLTKITIDSIRYGGDVIYKTDFFKKHKHIHQIPVSIVPTPSKYPIINRRRRRR